MAVRAYRACHLSCVGPLARIDDRNHTHVLVAAMPGRKRCHHLLRARNRFGVDHHRVGVHVSVVDHLAGAVRVHRPQMVIADLAAVDVFPSLVQNPPVGHHPRRVFLFRVGRELADLRPIAVATVEDRNLGKVAGHPSIAAAGAEDDTPVGQVGRLEVVERSVGQLPQAGAVDVDFVKVIVGLPAFAIGEEDLLAVVVELRIADAALGIVEERRDFARLHVHPAEPPAVVVILAVRPDDVIAEVGVPVTVRVGLADGENDLFHVALVQQRRAVALWGDLGRLSYRRRYADKQNCRRDLQQEISRHERFPFRLVARSYIHVSQSENATIGLVPVER